MTSVGHRFPGSIIRANQIIGTNEAARPMRLIGGDGTATYYSPVLLGGISSIANGAATLTGPQHSGTLLVQADDLMTLTTMTGTLLTAYFGSGVLPVGSSWELNVINLGDSTITFVGGTDVTVTGQPSVLPNKSATFRLYKITATTYAFVAPSISNWGALGQAIANGTPQTLTAIQQSGSLLVQADDAMTLTTLTGTQTTAYYGPLPLGSVWDLTIINLGDSTITMAGGTDVTAVGTFTVLTAQSATFRFVKLTATTYHLVRLWPTT